MSNDPQGTPTKTWSFNAPESYVILHGPNANGTAVFQQALVELLARGTIALTRVVDPAHRRRELVILQPGPRPAPPEEPALASLWLLYGGTPFRSFADGQTGVPLNEVVKAARKKYRVLEGYVAEEVLPNLIERGLFEIKIGRRLFIWKVRRIEYTPAGENVKADLAGRLELGEEQFGHWVDHEPGRARAYLASTGAGLLLMPALFPDLRRLGQSTPGQTTTGADSLSWSAPRDGDGHPDAVPWSLDHLDLGTGLDPGILTAIDSMISSVDSAISGDGGGGGDSGGGDGGGGDGGGGGGGDGG